MVQQEEFNKHLNEVDEAKRLVELKRSKYKEAYHGVGGLEKSAFERVRSCSNKQGTLE